MSKSQAIHKLLFVISILFLLCVAIQSPANSLHHKMQIEIFPGLKMLKAEDTVTFPSQAPRKISFLLHKGLTVSVEGGDDKLTLLQPGTSALPFAEYGLELGSQDNQVKFKFQGIIYDPVVNEESRGLISVEGAALFGETYWYPFFLGQQKKFDITVRTPPTWRALVQGQLTSSSQTQDQRSFQFVEIYPQEEIYLVAAEFKLYEMQTKAGPKVQILLRQNEPALAQSFMNLLPGYISHYAQEIAPYPYSTFSVVENFWETGYGMPGFTLLGPTVLRLPFILNSSLPHEVLHNWWGNSVYVDYERGNWSEGLTTYMADHWQQQLLGAETQYRLNTLIRYDDFVTQTPEKDFPVRAFKGRHNSSSQAVGYGKTMMIFRMLEFRFGKETFTKALKDFYRDNLYRKASFEELQRSFEKITGQDLSGFFQQWLDRTGAPKISLNPVQVAKSTDGYVSTYSLEQMSPQKYDLVIPLTWLLENGDTIKQVARLTESRQSFSFRSAIRPVQLTVDGDYDLFRQLYIEERPATLSGALGAAKVSLVADKGDSGAQDFAQVWSQAIEGQVKHVTPNELPLISTEGAIVLIGDRPEFRKFMEENLAGQNFAFTTSEINLQGQKYPWDEVSTAIVTRRRQNPQQTIVWVRWASDNAPKEWASRLTHYGTFGILIFEGRSVVHRSTWPVLSSPLKRAL